MIYLLEKAALALTEPQVTELIGIFKSCVEGLGAAINTLWITLSPALLAYLAYRQAVNKREVTQKIEENTNISTQAFTVANGHNAKIAASTKLVKEAVEAMTAPPQQVEVVNTPEHPIPITATPPA